MVRNLIYFFLITFFVLSCGPSSEDIDVPIDTTGITGGTPQEDSDAIEQIVQSFSSPVEMAALLKDVGVPFSLKYLCPTDNADDYNTNFKKALALGIFSIDLGYMNIYKKSSSIINHITVIKRLADGLKVGQFFDFQTIKDLAVNGENLDSLMYLSVNSFNQMDSYLRENDRANLSILIITGMWVEGLYIASQVQKEKANKDVAERIGEQKIVLNDIWLILKNYISDKNFSELVADLEDIKTVFDQVKITYEVGEPEAVEKNGMLIIVQNEKSNVTITDEQMKQITIKIEKIRNKLINV